MSAASAAYDLKGSLHKIIYSNNPLPGDEAEAERSLDACIHALGGDTWVYKNLSADLKPGYLVALLILKA